ncbi:iron dicitrate transport regulator FecR [Adhaeribacter arboris]|uniref:Iron dicitrate transport regulator FecR n=1 Tax=Adhaeribacter arboris TaxID=2072846 RepID=A0A2T2YET8_9BACT|nr:FecR domain-containing protein [Adhaeribacter arboris]PSR54031.1 iron dicitrate transport regulator FecR [Adhaeribacter arboris]
MKAEIDKHTLFNFFEGKATLMQRALIQKWLEEEANQELYYQWTEEWENENLQLTPDTGEAYQKLLFRIQEAGTGSKNCTTSNTDFTKVLPFLSSIRSFRYGYAAASVVFLLISFATLWVQKDQILNTEYRTAYGEVKTLALPDGSRVVMNANSSLRVPRFGFGSKSREVLLSGEAKFKIVHTKSHQKFIVRTPEQLEVEVLGTEFVVFSRKRGSKVVLNQGKVRLRSPKSGLKTPLAIRPGDVVTINSGGKLQLKHKQSLLAHQAWEEKRFIFDNTSVREIAAILEESFGIKLIIPDSLVANRTFGGTFKVTKPESLLQSLSEMLDLQLVLVDKSTYQLTEPVTAQP